MFFATQEIITTFVKDSETSAFRHADLARSIPPPPAVGIQQQHYGPCILHGCRAGLPLDRLSGSLQSRLRGWSKGRALPCVREFRDLLAM